MANPAQKRPLRNYRQRLSQQGLAQFEVLGFDSDRDLIRALARCLARNDSEAARLRAELRSRLTGEPPMRVASWQAYEHSPSWEPISTSPVRSPQVAISTYDPLPSRYKHHQPCH
jgi:hypothetical protein